MMSDFCKIEDYVVLYRFFLKIVMLKKVDFTFVFVHIIYERPYEKVEVLGTII